MHRLESEAGTHRLEREASKHRLESKRVRVRQQRCAAEERLACGSAALSVRQGRTWSGLSCASAAAAAMRRTAVWCALLLGLVRASEQCSEGPVACAERYYKIADEANGVATSCAAVDQTADPVLGVDLAGCQAACDAMAGGCNTVNFRVTDPNFNRSSSCYRKRCASFSTAVCTLFTQHKARDVYTKACGAAQLWASHVVKDTTGLFAGVKCPTSEPPVCYSTEQQPTSCSQPYYKIADEANGLAAGCAAADQTADPVLGVDLAGCQAACDAMAGGCDTVNFRVTDLNFNGSSSCYRKRCASFSTAVCTLFTQHKARDVYTKACGAAQLWASHVVKDATGLFAGVRCPSAAGDGRSGNATAGAPTCQRFLSTNRDSESCSACAAWSGGEVHSLSPVRTCVLWQTDAASGVRSCAQYDESAVERQQEEDYQQYLRSRWTSVGVCNLQYDFSTTCTITRNGRSCLVRDQPCHGSVTGLGGVAGVLSAGWRMSLDADSGRHVCTMCPRGSYGHCDDACNYRRNFFWSGVNRGRTFLHSATAADLLALYDAFVAELPEEDEFAPQELLLTPTLLARLPSPLNASLAAAGSTLVSVDESPLTGREQLRLLAARYVARRAQLLASGSGVKVYETCVCSLCPRGTYSDALGATACASCAEVLPGSDTEAPGTVGLESCRCLDDTYLDLSNASGVRCSSCRLVQQGLAAAPRGACGCGRDTYERLVEVSHSHSGEPLVTCAQCPDGSTTRHHEYARSLSDCECEAGLMRDASTGGCVECGSLLIAKDGECVLSSEVKVLIACSVLGFVILVAVGLLLVWRFQHRINKLEQRRNELLAQKIEEGISTITTLAHPMVLIRADDLIALGKLISHEEARARNLLTFVDSVDELEGLRKSHRLAFFSHQWLSWKHPDPDTTQYSTMVAALYEMHAQQTGSMEELHLDRLYVWIDYISIPQVHRGTQRLAINSLPVYAGCCDFFVIVVPGSSMHVDTEQLCDAQSYHQRAWCRAEQLAYVCRVGIEDMYIASTERLEPVTWDWLSSSLMVFEGELTCCSRKHVGMPQCDREFLVSPMLGLYAELLARRRRHTLQPKTTEVLEFMVNSHARMFPAHFDFVREGFRNERRELFGATIQQLERHSETPNVLDQLSNVRSTRPGRGGSTSRAGSRGNKFPPSSISSPRNLLDRVSLRESAAFGKGLRTMVSSPSATLSVGSGPSTRSRSPQHSNAALRERNSPEGGDAAEAGPCVGELEVGACRPCVGEVEVGACRPTAVVQPKSLSQEEVDFGGVIV